MKKSYISILLLAMVMILAISAVSAAEDIDTSDSDLQAVDEAAVDEVASADVDDVVSTDNTDLLADPAVSTSKNFTQLQSDIDTASGAVLMSSDCVRVDGENDIVITKDTTILGNNYKIDANNKGGIFKVNQGFKLTLIGVTLINGNANSGAAIYNDGGSLTIVDSYLLNNTATSNGGAIYNDGGSLTATGTVFDGNDLTARRVNSGGAAIFDKGGTILLSECNVTNNLKNIVPRGGYDATDDLCSAAVSSSGTVTVTNSYFSKNSGSYGGAILVNETGVLTVSGTTFENNYAYNGGAIDIVNDASYSITNCTFKGNVANGTGSKNTNIGSGGAISAQDASAGSVISDCIFEDNAAAYGGAIDATIIEIVGSTFTNNSASSSYAGTFKGSANNRGGDGGAIRITRPTTTVTPAITIKDSVFNNNGGTGNYYGVSLTSANSEITGSSFTNTIIDIKTAGIAILSDNTYDNDGFTSENFDIRSANTIPLTLGEGQVPKIKLGKVYTDINNFTRLQEVIDNVSGSIYLTGDVAKLASEAETFANGILINKSIGIYGEGFTISSNSGKVFNVAKDVTLELYDANIVGDGTSAIVNDGQVTLYVNNPSAFSNVGNYAIENNGLVYESGLTTFTQLNNLIGLVNGGEIGIYRSQIKQTDAEKDSFTNGIVIDKDVTINGNVDYNKKIRATIDANNYGRIFNVTNGATLTLNKMILKNGNADEGAAVYVEDGATFIADTVDFIDNVATNKGGAIYSEGTVKVNHTTFDANDISNRSSTVNRDFYGGAAIYNLDGTLTVDNSVFKNNIKNYVKGPVIDGAITTLGTATITNSEFRNNTALYGGAIMMAPLDNQAKDSTLTIDNCKFYDHVGSTGGAIQAWNGDNANYVVNVLNSYFENNNALSSGGALVINRINTTTIKNTTFKNNRATVMGAAVYIESSNANIDNCTFEDNRASHGGAVMINYGNPAIAQSNYSGVISIKSSEFINNSATSFGGAVYSTANELIIDNVTFKENSAPTAGAIYLNKPKINVPGTVNIKDANFTDNTATNNASAIYVREDVVTSVEGSTFTNNGAVTDYAIYNLGTLSLDGNTVSNLIYNKGAFNSEFTAEVLNNKTYETAEASYKLNATLTDKNGNKIYDPNFKFVVNGVEVAFDTYDNGVYIVNAYPITTDYAVYIVNASSTNDTNLVTKISIIKNLKYGTFTDLQQRIDKAILAGVDLILPYDFKYNEAIDGATYKDGVVISQNINIDANGTTINANNTARIFKVINGVTLTLTNATLTNGKADMGAAVYVEAGATLNADYVNFTDNTATYKGGAIYSEGTVKVNHTTFDANDISNRSSTVNRDFYGGAAIYNLDGTLTVDNSVFKNNIKNYVKGPVIDGAITTLGTATITNSEFTNNTALYGGAIMMAPLDNQAKDSTLTIDNCKFYENVGSTGSAIQAWNGNDANYVVNVLNSHFENNNALSSGALVINRINTTNIKNTTFKNNRAVSMGAAVYIESSNADIDNCTFEDNNASYGAAVMVNYGNPNIGQSDYSGDISIKSSKFINNSATQIGGAIYSTANKLVIDNTTFKENSAPTAGAIYINKPAKDPISNKISNSEFISNEATGNGGAIFYYNPGVTLDITDNTNFTNNTAGNTGGAIVIADGTLNIKDAGFTGNTATNNGSAIFVRANAVTSVEDSTFTKNGATTEYGIYNLGALSLPNTKVDNLVYSDGKFNTELNATFLNNNTWYDGVLYGAYTLNATLTDQNGNKIYDPNFRFAVDEVNITDIPKYNETTGLYTVEYIIPSSGLKVISTNYEATGLVKYSGALDIALANVTEFTVNVANTTEHDNTTVIISLLGVNGEKLNATIRVYINNTEIPVTVENGTGSYVIEGLDHGSYAVVAFFDGNSNYNNAINSTVFYVKGQSKLTIANLTTAVYGDVIEVIINLTDSNGNPLNGTVVINETIQVLVENGIGKFVTIEGSNPDVGEYYFNATYEGNNELFGCSEGFTVNVTAKEINNSDVIVGISGDAPDNVTVTVSGPDSVYNITVDDQTVQVVVTDGVGTANITGLTAGNKTATVAIDDDNYELTPFTEEFKYRFVPGAYEAEFNATYPTVEITITGQDGEYLVTIGEFSTPVTVEGGVGTANITDIDAGKYTANVTFIGNDTYNSAEILYDIEVAKANASVLVYAASVVEGENVTINVYAMSNNMFINTTAKVTVDGHTYDVNVTDGEGIKTLSLAPGVHDISAVLADDNYNFASDSLRVYVKYTTTLTISTEKDEYDYGEIINITVNLVAGDVGVNGTVYVSGIPVLVVDGVGVLPIDNQPDVGVYNFTATYDGDNDYNASASEEISFNVTAKVIDRDDVVCIFMGDYNDGLNITINSPVDGIYTVAINEIGVTVEVEVIDNIGNVTVYNLAANDYNATITFNDSNYSLDPITEKFTYKAVPEFTVTITGTYPTAEIKINGTAGFYYIDIPGFDLIEIEVSGYEPSVYTIDYIDAGEYTYDVYYNATAQYREAVRFNQEFTIAKANATLDVFAGDIVAGEPAVIEIKAVNDDLEAINTTVKLIVSNDAYDDIVFVMDGNATVTIPDLEQGSYDVTVVIDDDNYNFASASWRFYVKHATNLTVATDLAEYVYGTPVEIDVTLNATSSSLVFTVSLTVDEKEYNVVIENGAGHLTLNDLPVGEYTITSHFDGDDVNNYTEGDVVSFNVTVKEIDPDDVTVNFTGDAPDALTITVTSDVEGSYIVSIEGYGNVTVEVKDGQGVATIDDLAPGVYTASATIDDGNYTLLKDGLEVPYKYNPVFNVTAGGTYPNINLTINGTAGQYIIGIKDIGIFEINITNDGDFKSLILDDVAAGVYDASVGFVGNNTYNIDVLALTITVEKAASAVTIDPITDVIYGNPIVITYNIDNRTAPQIILKRIDEASFDKYLDYNDTVITANLPAGDYVIEVINPEGDNFTGDSAIAEFSVIKAEALTITYDGDYVAMGAGTVNITVAGDATGYVFIDDNGLKISGKLVNGSYSYEIYDIPAGDYVITVTYSGDDNYNETTANKTLPISKANVTITTDIKDEYIGEDFNFTVDILPDFAYGNVTVFIDGNVYSTVILDEDYANATVSITFLAEGPHTIGIQYNGNDLCEVSEIANYTTKVTKYDSQVTIEQPIADVPYGSPVVIIYSIVNETDFVTISITDLNDPDKQIEFIYNETNITVEGLPVGNYMIDIHNGANALYRESEANATFNVTRAPSEVTVLPIETVAYGEDVYVYFTVVNKTNVSDIKVVNAITLENVTVQYDLFDAEGYVVLHDLVPGNYSITISVEGNVSYLPSAGSGNFTVVQDVPVITINVENAYYTSDVNVTFAIDPAFLDYVIKVFNETYGPVNFTNSGNTIILNNLTTGYYGIEISAVENENYTTATASASFYVSIMDINPPANSSDTVFEITMPEDAGGYLLVDIDGQHYYAPVENGTASVTVPQLVPGNYTANVTYTGDGNYPGFSTTKNVTVESNVPDSAFTIPESAKSDAPTTYSIKLDENAGGVLEVDVDGTIYRSALNKGEASVTIPALSEGEHNVTVTYTGDKKHTPVVKETKLNVTAPVFKITNNKNVGAVYSAKANYKVLVLREGKAVGAGETVTFKYNGKTYTAKTDAKGYATLKLNTKVKVKKYTITATYKGVTVKNTVTIKHLIKAKNAKIKKSKKVNKIKVKTKKVNGKYLKGKKLKLKITKVSKSKKKSSKSSASSSTKKSTSKGKAKYITAKINKKGVATFKLKKKVTKKLKAGKKYKYTVIYGKDKVTKKLKVKK